MKKTVSIVIFFSIGLIIGDKYSKVNKNRDQVHIEIQNYPTFECFSIDIVTILAMRQYNL
ncbi:MAG: hypothetical protein DRP26_04745 [Candidatus Zixiibacteriota bacterium]|nr:MAG: hypothetical protein DRP26_04745 [candidate division Zixibacteria bacterium]